MPIKKYNDYFKSLHSLKKPQFNKVNTLKWNNYNFAYKDIYSLTFGEYLDATNYANSNEIAKLMAIFYRLFEPRKLDKPKLEPYDFDINYRSEFFKTIPSIFFFQIKHDLEKLDKIISKNYKDLFEEEQETQEVEAVDKRTEAQFLHEQRIKQSFQKNAWKYTAYALSNNDATKLDEVYNTNLFTILNVLRLEKDLELRRKK